MSSQTRRCRTEWPEWSPWTIHNIKLKLSKNWLVRSFNLMTELFLLRSSYLPSRILARAIKVRNIFIRYLLRTWLCEDVLNIHNYWVKMVCFRFMTENLFLLKRASQLWFQSPLIRFQWPAAEWKLAWSVDGHQKFELRSKIDGNKFVSFTHHMLIVFKNWYLVLESPIKMV